MSTIHAVDAARLSLLLNELRLPAIKLLWPQFAEQSDKEGWPAARFLATIAEHELAERGRRRIERHLAEARLPPGKTLDNFDFEAVPMVSKAQVTALAAGDGWLGKGANLLLFGSLYFYRSRDWVGALEAIELCRSIEHNFGLTALFDLYWTSIQGVQESAPPADWERRFRR